jgi:hypothetical protein
VAVSDEKKEIAEISSNVERVQYPCAAQDVKGDEQLDRHFRTTSPNTTIK